MSDKTLDKLIATLKTEAIDVAENKSNKIIEDAKAKAEKIVKDAEQKKESIINDAEKQAEIILYKGKSALQQSERDLHVTLQNEILQLLGTVLENEVETVFTPNLIKSAVVKVIENIGSGVALKLPEDFEQEMADFVFKKLKNSEDIVSITKTDSLLKQLSISKTGEGWSYDISPKEVAELLNNHLSKKWIERLKNDTEK